MNRAIEADGSAAVSQMAFNTFGVDIPGTLQIAEHGLVRKRVLFKPGQQRQIHSRTSEPVSKQHQKF